MITTTTTERAADAGLSQVARVGPDERTEPCPCCKGFGVDRDSLCHACGGISTRTVRTCSVPTLIGKCNAAVDCLDPDIRSNRHVYGCLNGHRWARTTVARAPWTWARLDDVPADTSMPPASQA